MKIEQKLVAGNVYNHFAMECVRFVDSAGNTVDGTGLHCGNWFSYCRYLGPDSDGIEPVFAMPVITRIGQRMLFGRCDHEESQYGMIVAVDGNDVTVAWDPDQTTTQSADWLGVVVSLADCE